MIVTIRCPRLVFSGERSDPCGCAIEVDVEIPKLTLVASADDVELPLECFYHHRFDQEEVADLKAQINDAVEKMENAPVYGVDDYWGEDERLSETRYHDSDDVESAA